MSAPIEPGQPGKSPAAGEPVPSPRAGRPPAPSGDDRPRRFVSGTAAPGALSPPPVAPVKPPVATAPPTVANPVKSDDAYRSELPDLSKEAPRRAAARRTQVGAGQRGPLRASMQIRRIDPWSALKVSLLLSTALFFVWMIAVAVLYVMLGAMGVWSKLNSNVGDLLTNNSAAELVSAGSIFGGAALIGLVNIVVLTAMATIGVVIYNLSTDVVGGVEVTLADRD